METYDFQLKKMKTTSGNPIGYTMSSESKELSLNTVLGKDITITYRGKINCVSCGVPVKKTMGEGFCYKCFLSAPEASPCIIRPEICEGHLGKGRDVEWEMNNHVQPHIVYLALSSSVKVGITRASQVPFRWFDQGAVAAIPLVECPYRQEAGRIEVLLKNIFTDKTSWQKMLKNEVDAFADLNKAKEEALNFLGNNLGKSEVSKESICEINYPVLKYPEKITSIKLDRTESVQGQLLGIKGQYLLLSDDRVINIRSHSGYHIEVKV